MEQFDDMNYDYIVRERNKQPVTRDTRFQWLLLLPSLGVLWLLYLMGAALFQWPVTDVVNPIMSLILVLFAVLVGLLFWAMAPGVDKG